MNLWWLSVVVLATAFWLIMQWRERRRLERQLEPRRHRVNEPNTRSYTWNFDNWRWPDEDL